MASLGAHQRIKLAACSGTMLCTSSVAPVHVGDDQIEGWSRAARLGAYHMLTYRWSDTHAVNTVASAAKIQPHWLVCH